MVDVARYLLIGQPLNHSLSPALFQYWFNQYSISAEYLKAEININEIEALLSNIASGTIAGANVTLPYKERIFERIANPDPYVQTIGAVNTLVRSEGGGVNGINTDAPALEESLSGLMDGRSFSSRIACIFGSGGGARTAVQVLLGGGVEEIRVVARNARASGQMLTTQHNNLRIFSWDQAERAAQQATILINTTPLGQIGFPAFPNLRLDQQKSGVALDLVYNPSQTSFLKLTKEASFRTQNGFSMLLAQAALSFQAWFGWRPQAAGITPSTLFGGGEV